VIRTSSEVDNQSAENKASNEGDYPKGQQQKDEEKEEHTLDDREDKLG
jgi:hypothetical protein